MLMSILGLASLRSPNLPHDAWYAHRNIGLSFARAVISWHPGKSAGLRTGGPIPYAISRSRQAITRAIDTIPDPKALMGSALLRQYRQYRQHRLRIKAPVPVRAEDGLDPRHLHCR